MILRPQQLLEKMLKIRKEGKPRQGVSTGFETLDDVFLLNKRRLMVVTGVPNQGKSVFVDSLAINTAILHDWKWTFFTPESDPEEGDHMQALVDYYLGKGLGKASISEVTAAVQWAQDNFSWITPKDIKAKSPEAILEAVSKRMEDGEKIDALVIDPWNKCNHVRQHTMRDDIYLGDMLSRICDFAKAKDLFVIIVVHPHGVQKNKDGLYPTIHLRECNGGITWYAACDYGICVNRRHPLKHGADIYVQKIKTKRIGRLGTIFLDYEPDGGRFKDEHAKEYLLPESLPVGIPFQ